jgi:hypothetical protein
MANEMVPTRRIQAFVGGLDLTNGRYDYPSHPLFDSCAPGGPHCIDHYQGCVEGALQPNGLWMMIQLSLHITATRRNTHGWHCHCCTCHTYLCQYRWHLHPHLHCTRLLDAPPQGA